MKVITIAQQKGGVGKSTVAVTVASGLAALGIRALLVDTDSQGSIAHFLSLDPAGDLFDLVVSRRPLAECVVSVPDFERLSVVRSDASTVDVETLLLGGSKRISRRDALAGPLARYAAFADVAIVDTAPSLSAVQVAALAAADWLIVPVIPEFASEAGVAQLVQTIAELGEHGARAHLLGVLPNLVDVRSKEHAATLADLERTFPGLVLPRVRRLIALGEAPRAGRPIWTYQPRGEAAADFAAVLREVVRRAEIRA